MTISVDAQAIYGELSQLREEVQALRSQLDRMDKTLRPAIRTAHPFIVRLDGVHGGRPTVRGAGVSVQTIVERTQRGQTPQQIVDDFDGVLSLAHVYDALSYFHANEAEIERAITANREALWKGPTIASS